MKITVRRSEIRLLPSQSESIRILHFSDLHLMPYRKWQLRELSKLADLKPDFVISTGDFIASNKSIDPLCDSLRNLLKIPGAFVFGSNDYYAPTFKNPFSYLKKDDGKRKLGKRLNTDTLREKLVTAGWFDLNNNSIETKIKNLKISFLGIDDAHLNLDKYEEITQKDFGTAELKIGVTHAPYSRIISKMAADDLDIVFAGHTHGGQIRIPWFGGSRSLTTNCDLPNWRSRGLTKLANEPWLNVSAGVGYSPFAPIRIACAPEVSLIELTASDTL
jgi:predicted MPP superfamily phosphohydrolase